jgi:hypothetical protein
MYLYGVDPYDGMRTEVCCAFGKASQNPLHQTWLRKECLQKRNEFQKPCLNSGLKYYNIKLKTMARPPKRRKIKSKNPTRGCGKLGHSQKGKNKNTLSKIEKATDMEKEAILGNDPVEDCKRETGGFL